MTLRLELTAQLAEVVDLPVHDEPTEPSRSPRLVARLEVDDRQPAEAEAYRDVADRIRDVEPFVVRATVAERRSHTGECLTVDRIRADDAADAAHGEVARYGSGEGSSKFSALTNEVDRFRL